MVITGKGIQAEMRNESPEEYVARIRKETEGGYLVFVDEAGAEIYRHGPLAWEGGESDPRAAMRVLSPGLDGFVPRATTLRLVDANGRDVGWRGPIAYADMRVLLASLRIYPPQ